MKPYYADDAVTIYHADCREVLPTLERVDHVITDPPYSEATHSGARSLVDDKRYGGTGENVVRIDFGSTSADEIRAVFEAASPRRWTIATIDWRHMLPLEQCPPSGSRFVRFGVWVKPNGAPQFTGDRPATGWEAIAFLHADAGKMRWNGGGKRAVWTFVTAHAEHPTAKPLSLMCALISDFTDPGDLILDPFGGSGTTARAAKDLGRRCILIEREERWAEVAAKRMAQSVLPLEAAR